MVGIWALVMRVRDRNSREEEGNIFKFDVDDFTHTSELIALAK
jgi:hypothetical protein